MTKLKEVKKQARSGAIKKTKLYLKRIEQVISDMDQLFTHGDLIRHEWIRDNIWIEKPALRTDIDMEKAIEIYDKEMTAYQLRLMGIRSDVQAMLAKEYNKFMVSIRGRGYYILQPDEHADHATEIMKRGIDRAHNKAKFVIDTTSTQRLGKKDTGKLWMRSAQINNIVSEARATMNKHNFDTYLNPDYMLDVKPKE